MPEGDTIFRAALALHRTLAGHVVTRFETGVATLARVNDDTPLVGQTVQRCASLGKHVLMEFSGGLTLRTHMRMHGSWHLYRPGEKWQRSSQAMRVRIDTDAWVAVAFDVPVAEFVATSGLHKNRAIGALGPDLLAPDFDREDALRRLEGVAARPIADALLDQRLVAGIGNVYKSEVLFVCGVHPRTPITALTRDQLNEVIDTARSMMQANIGSEGPAGSGGGMRATTGRMNPAERLWVYSRKNLPCLRCGTAVASSKDGLDARSTYWCPKCQPAV